MMATKQVVKFISRVLEQSPSRRDIAKAHFVAKLEHETDPSDVYFDLQNGESGFTILDVRPAEAFAESHVPGAISMPRRKITAETTAGWPKDRLLVVYCYSPACNAATKAAVKLTELGFSVKEMIGGIQYWKEEGYPVQKEGEPKVSLSAPVVG